jgi:hypothetical protein
VYQKVDPESFSANTDYYEKDSVYIFNPSANGGKAFIRAKQTCIYADGSAQFGSIEIDGKESTIYGGSWKLTPDRAEFQNVSVSGSIDTAVFNVGTTQAIGSAMLFMNSYKIIERASTGEGLEIKVEGYDFTTVDDKLIFEEGLYGWLVENNRYEECQILSATIVTNTDDGMDYATL